jgi:hypothetical protein
MSPPSSGLKSKQARNQHEAGCKYSMWLADVQDSTETEGNLEANPSNPIGSLTELW